MTNREVICRIVLEHCVTNPRVFGSVSSGEDTEDSDLDILVDPLPDSLMDIGKIRHKLLQLPGIVRVDVLTPNSLPLKFQAHVLAEAVLV